MRIVLNAKFGEMIYPEECESRQDIIDLFESLEETSDEELIKAKQEKKICKT